MYRTVQHSAALVLALSLVAAAGEFTPITDGYMPFALSNANQYATALDEHRWVLALDIDQTNRFEEGWVAAPVSATVTNIHTLYEWSYWRAFQVWISNNCTAFVNHTVPIAGSNAPTYYTWKTFREVAGLSTNGPGFRWARKWTPGVGDWQDPEDPMYGQQGVNDGGHGFCAVGHIFGPWFYEDLQNCFSAMKWTATKVTTIGTSTSASGSRLLATGRDYSQFHPNIAFNNCVAAWTTSWAAFTPSTWYQTKTFWGTQRIGETWYWFVEAQRVGALPKYTWNKVTPLPFGWVVFGLPDAPEPAPGSFDPTWDPWFVHDAALAAQWDEGLLWQWDTGMVANATISVTATNDFWTDYTTCPASSSPALTWTGMMNAPPYRSKTRTAFISELWWIWKWSWTYSND